MEELIKLYKEYQQISRPYQALGKIKLNGSDGLEKLERALGELPSGEVFCRSIDEWRKKIMLLIEAEKNRRRESFGKLFSDFIRNQRELGTLVREFSSTRWRVGPFEINLRPVQSQVKFSYDEESVMNWTTVSTGEDINRLYSRMVEKLKKNEIPWLVFCDALWEAYEYLKKKQEINNVHNYRSVPSKDLIRETIVVLYRYSLDRKIVRLKDESPWVFRYNLDLYYARSQDIPEGKRISREAGSQNEIRQDKGIILNGLSANEDYKIFCYFRA